MKLFMCDSKIGAFNVCLCKKLQYKRKIKLKLNTGYQLPCYTVLYSDYIELVKQNRIQVIKQ